MPSGRFPPVSSARAATRAPLVVIADAQEWFSRALETVLVPGGYSVLKAYTAPGLLRQIETSEPDAVILAVDLPGGDGLNLCRLLRADDRVTPSTPIILTQPSPTNRRQMLAALRAGAGDLWGPQLDAEALLLRLAAQLRSQAPAAPAGPAPPRPCTSSSWRATTPSPTPRPRNSILPPYLRTRAPRSRRRRAIPPAAGSANTKTDRGAYKHRVWRRCITSCGP